MITYTVPPHKQWPFTGVIEGAEKAGASGEDAGMMMCAESARELATVIGPEETKSFLRFLIEAVDEAGPDDIGSQSVH